MNTWRQQTTHQGRWSELYRDSDTSGKTVIRQRVDDSELGRLLRNKLITVKMYDAGERFRKAMEGLSLNGYTTSDADRILLDGCLRSKDHHPDLDGFAEVHRSLSRLPAGSEPVVWRVAGHGQALKDCAFDLKTNITFCLKHLRSGLEALAKFYGV